MATADEIVILRIELQGIEPLIWRRVAVRAGTSLMGVHHVIQATMGWLDCHLWDFEVNGRKYGMRLPDDPDWNERVENADTISLGTLLHAGERQMQYVYDMGDFWDHSIIFERVTAPLPEVSYRWCLSLNLIGILRAKERQERHRKSSSQRAGLACDKTKRTWNSCRCPR